MPKSTTITRDVILENAFEIVRKEGFAVLTARNIAQKIGCSTQPIYWAYKNMDDLKSEIIQKALRHLKNRMCEYRKTGNPFLDLGLGYVQTAHTEPVLFKAIYVDNILNVKMTELFIDNREIVEIMQGSADYQKMSGEGMTNIIEKSWMLAHGIASLVATGLFVYDEEKILEILE